MPVPAAAATSPDDGGPADRKRWLFLGLVALAALSAVIAAVVIFSSGGTPKPAGDQEVQVRASHEAMIVGRTDAPTKVVIFEDFGSAPSREFELASRDFLEVAATKGDVRVEYRPFHLTDGYSRRALEAWSAVLQHGSAQEAMRFHELLFDRQPATRGPVPTDDELDAWAVEAGADEGVVRAGLERPDPAFIESAREAARAAGVVQVPAVFLDDKPLDLGSGIELADLLQRWILKD